MEYVSSSVLSFLMVTQGRAQEKGGKVSLVGASDLVRQVFEMASLDALFDFRAKLEDLGLALQSPAAPAKGKEKAPRKEKVVALKEAKPVLSTGEGTTTPTQEARMPEKERVVPVSGHEWREAREVEKIHPLAETRSWKDYGVWIGIGVLALVSLAVSSYLYLQR